MIVQKRTTTNGSPRVQPHAHCANLDHATGAGWTNTNAGHMHRVALRRTQAGVMAVAEAVTPQGVLLDHEHAVENVACGGNCGPCNAR